MITTLWTSVAAPLLVLVSDQVEKGPEAEDVKAGWLALFIFIGLALAVVFLAFSLVKQLRKAQAAKDAGVYGDEPVVPEERSGPTE
jgi:TRAP-type C4-dicarboxylate transport system permease small subunit